MRSRPLPPYPDPEKRSTPMLALGETHHYTTPGRAPQPTWLTIPQRGLYTGTMVLGAVGTGKTSACMYPYVDQLLRWRSDDPHKKIGGLVLEVKGDFCGQVRSGPFFPAQALPTTISRSGSTRASATTRSTTIWIRMPSPTRSPPC